jgi:hypothetical protein
MELRTPIKMTNNGNSIEEWKVRDHIHKEFRIRKLLKKNEMSIE